MSEKKEIKDSDLEKVSGGLNTTQIDNDKKANGNNKNSQQEVNSPTSYRKIPVE